MTATAQRDNYVGQRKQQLRDGYGVYVYENKFFRYEGEWVNGVKQGHGKLCFADGSYYEGEFQNGEIQGHGFRHNSRTGDQYSGEFEEGEFHGQGVMKYGDGSTYEGQWIRNKRQGYGVFKTEDNSVYKGYLHNHLRHGEGSQLYSNGDHYAGDWVMGQFRGDLFNGQGHMAHISGFVYEGLWTNGRPSTMATRIVHKGQEVIEITQGVGFSLEIECQNDDGEKVSDEGRLLEISAGYRHSPPTATKTDTKEAALFDVIEDFEEKPIQTPFGYDVMPYPLTDQVALPEDAHLLGAGGRSLTSLSATSETSQGEEGEGEESTKEENDIPPVAEKQPTEDIITTTDPALEPQTTHLSTEPTAPAVLSTRTQEGCVTYPRMGLAAPPPMYRPYTLEDEQLLRDKSKSKSKLKKEGSETSATSRASSRASKENLGRERSETKQDDERVSRPVSRNKSKFARASRKLAVLRRISNLEEKPTPPKVTGQYVIMVRDVTDPPFMGYHLQPLYLQLKVLPPKKTKTKGKKAADKGPKWDTGKHIAQAMAKAHSDFAASELEPVSES